nr:hypothetical protein [Tanacetum cinerariifolium]
MVTEMKILDILEQRIEKVGKHLNKAKEKMDINKGKEKIVMERDILQWYDDLSSDEQRTVSKGRSRSSSRNATITKPEKPKLRSKHLAPTTPRTGSTSTTLLVLTKRPPLVTNYALGLAAVKTWQQIMNKEFRIKKAKDDVGGSSDVRRKGKRKIALIATTLRDLIGSNGRLIAEDPAPGVSQVAMPRPPCLTMQDLYDRMGNMKIHQGSLCATRVEKENENSHTSSCTKLRAVL